MKKVITVLLVLSMFCVNFYAQVPKWTTYNNQNTSSKLPDNNVDELATDASGNIWIGTYFWGLVKFDGTNWTNYNSNNSSLKDNTINGLKMNGSTLWIATYANGIYKFDGSNWTNYTAANSGILSNYTYCITTDAGNNVWVGINTANSSYSGVVKFNGSSTWTQSSFTDNYNYYGVEAVAKDNAGNIWCGTRIGLYKYNGSSWTTYTKENTSGGLCGNYVRSIAVDASGNVWFGCEDKDPVTGYFIGGGLSKFNGSTWTSYTPSNSNLKTGYISAIAFRNNDVWVGTGFCGQVSDNKGLYKFDGTTWTSYVNDNNTFPGTCVNDLVVDKNNNLWIGSSWGLTKVDFNPTAVEDKEEIPSAYKLDQNYPNPFNPETVISYQLPAGGKVRLSVTDLLGREVALIVDEFQSAGTHNAKLSIQNYQLSSGVYFYKLQTEKYSEVKKMVVMK